VIVVLEILGCLAVQWDSEFYRRVWEYMANNAACICVVR